MPTYSRRTTLPIANRISGLRRALESQGRLIHDLTVTNPTLAIKPYPHQEIADALAATPDFTYLPEPFGPLSAREQLAPVCASQPEDIVLASSTSEVYSWLMHLLCDAEDQILVPAPSYPLLQHLADYSAVQLVPYRLAYDGAWHIDFDHLIGNTTPATRAIVVVSPNNPTGNYLSEREAELLAVHAATHRLPVIVDSVFAFYSFGNRAPEMPELPGVLSFVLNGLSKYCGMPQMKLAWLSVHGPDLQRTEALARLELIADTFLPVATPVALALPRLLEIGQGVRGRIRSLIHGNLQIVDELGSTSLPCTRLHLEGGWSALLQLPNTRPEEEWATILLEKYGVVVQPGYFYDMASEAYIVLSLLSTSQDLRCGQEALTSMLSRT